jgi:UrcA family protein
VIYAVVALALVVLAVVNITAALPRSETPAVRIRIGDLDLASDSGMAALDARLDAAADDVCRQLQQDGIPLPSGEQACRRDVRREIAEHLGALQPCGAVSADALIADTRPLVES